MRAGSEGEFAEQFAGGGVDDADVQVLDQQQDVGSADADVVEPPGVAEGGAAGLVDGVGADTVVGVGGAVAGCGLGPGGVGGGRGDRYLPSAKTARMPRRWFTVRFWACL